MYRLWSGKKLIELNITVSGSIQVQNFESILRHCHIGHFGTIFVHISAKSDWIFMKIVLSMYIFGRVTPPDSGLGTHSYLCFECLSDRLTCKSCFKYTTSCSAT